MWAVERKQEILASMPDEDLGLAATAEESTERPFAAPHWRLDIMRPHEPVAEVPVEK